jgi:hypothetical protein
MEDLGIQLEGSGGFKWEESPGLLHGCGVCGKCLNAKSARLTCYGIHAEPCVRYHQTMFHKGNSHKCEACRNSNEQHDKRHREIATIIQKIQFLDADAPDAAGSKRPLARSSSSRYQVPRKASLAPFRARYPENDDSDNEKAGWARKATSQALLRQSLGRVLVCRPDNENSDTESIASFQDNMQRSPSCKVKRELKQAARLAKATSRALQRQEQSKGPEIVSNIAVQRVDIAIHGHQKSCNSASPEHFALALIENIELHRRLEEELKKLKRDDHSDSNAIQLGYVREVLISLGVQPFRQGGSKERRSLVQQAAEQIYHDLELVANENRETLKRSCGYWRYASKKTYYAMLQNNKQVDWATGEIKMACV